MLVPYSGRISGATTPSVRSVAARRLLEAATWLTTPLLPDDFLAEVNPLWSTREARGRVDAVRPETPDSATLLIRPGVGWGGHVPGQYVRVGVDVRGVRHWRTYSLTSVPGRADGRIAITVKVMAGGLVSTQLVRRTPPGTILRLTPAAGDFVLPRPTPARLLFVTAGSGVTPIMGVLRALAARGPLPALAHLHLAPARDDVIFGAELRRLARDHPRMALAEHHDDTDGTFDVAALDARCPDWRERETWACGPAGLLDALSDRFAAEGIADRLHVERFAGVIVTPGAEGAGGHVRFTRSDREFDADGATPLLAAGEAAGAILPHGCRMGICNTCVGRLRSGAVRDLRTGALHDTEGELVRICVSAAAGPVEIDL